MPGCQSVSLETCEACQSVCRTSGRGRIGPRNVIIFKQTLIYFFFSWSTWNPSLGKFSQNSLWGEEQKGAKGSAQLREAKSIHSTDAAPDVNCLSPAQRAGPVFSPGGIQASQKAELQSSPLPDRTHSGPTETKFWPQFRGTWWPGKGASSLISVLASAPN